MKMSSQLRLIDGEIGTQLLKYVPELEGDPLWYSRYNVTNPEAVYKCYVDFMAAGCELIRTNSYQSSVAGFQEHLNYNDAQCNQLFQDIVNLAQKARDDFVAGQEEEEEGQKRRTIEVWASIGSYGAYLSDGSEYSGSFLDSTDSEKIRKFHRDRLDILLTQRTKQLGLPPVDGVAVETIPSVVEAEIVVQLFNELYPDVPYWVSFNCKDGQATARGERFNEAAEAIWNLAKDKSLLIGVGVNCVDPKIITPLFELVDNKRRSSPIPLIAYPNTGERFDVELRRYVDVPDRKELSYFVAQWLELGLTTVGGCCRNGSDQITNLRQYLDKRPTTTTTI